MLAVQCCLFKHYILSLCMSVGSVMRHYSERNHCSSIYMICPCSVTDSTSALEPDSVHCTQEAVGMPVMKFI